MTRSRCIPYFSSIIIEYRLYYALIFHILLTCMFSVWILRVRKGDVSACFCTLYRQFGLDTCVMSIFNIVHNGICVKYCWIANVVTIDLFLEGKQLFVRSCQYFPLYTNITTRKVFVSQICWISLSGWVLFTFYFG